MTSPPRRRPIAGNDPGPTMAGMLWTQWDLWFSFVCTAEHAGNWDALGEGLEERGNPWEHDTEAKRSHIDDLAARLRRAGLQPDQLVTDLVGNKPLQLKARTKVLKQELMHRDLTEPMVSTPRRRLRERALHGWWDRFPASPWPFYEEFADEVESRDFYGEGATMELAHRLSTVSSLRQPTWAATSGSRSIACPGSRSNAAGPT